VGGLECNPTMGEITYGLERLTMYLQNIDNVYDLMYTQWNDGTQTRALSYRDVFHQNEVEASFYDFEQSNPELLLRQFGDFESEAKRLMQENLALPAYEMVLKANHTFNLLDARGAISVTERTGYMGRIRALAHSVAASYYASRERLGFPMAREGTDPSASGSLT
jgi:glycyl-tRNA synthetase alpha chain